MRCLFQEGILRGLSDSLSSSKVRLVLLLLNDNKSIKFYCGRSQQDELKYQIFVLYTDFGSKNTLLYYLKRGVHYTLLTNHASGQNVYKSFGDVTWENNDRRNLDLSPGPLSTN